MSGRAFFRGDHRPSRLVLDSVKDTDAAVYKCRVDYSKAPTRISNVVLEVIGEFKEEVVGSCSSAMFKVFFVLRIEMSIPNNPHYHI